MAASIFTLFSAMAASIFVPMAASIFTLFSARASVTVVLINPTSASSDMPSILPRRALESTARHERHPAGAARARGDEARLLLDDEVALRDLQAAGRRQDRLPRRRRLV